MTDTDTLLWFRAVQRVAADVTGIKTIHGVTPLTTGPSSGASLRPATDSLTDLPALVLAYGGADITAGSWERQTHTVNGAIWRARDPIAETYDALIADIGRVLNAFPARGKAYSISSEVQSLLVTGFGAIDGIEWAPGSNRWYLVLPFTMELIVNRPAAYVPA